MDDASAAQLAQALRSEMQAIDSRLRQFRREALAVAWPDLDMSFVLDHWQRPEFAETARIIDEWMSVPRAQESWPLLPMSRINPIVRSWPTGGHGLPVAVDTFDAARRELST